MIEPLLAARGLTCGYGDVSVVRAIDLTLHEGEIVALFGPNGAGKTTTLLTLAGDLPAIAGEVTWRGEPMTLAMHQRARRGLVLVPEEKAVFMSMSVRDNLLIGSGGLDGALELFPELEPLLQRKAGLLSGGEQQMVSVARALATKPRALLVDELSLGLAPLAVERLFRALRRAADESGVAILLVEQQAKRALRLAHRWYLMKQGSVVSAGRASDDAAILETSYLADAAAGTDVASRQQGT